ncbi:hypothetical protein D1007_27984 [Hordeum vulgare]|nr:hypothetical protein D1007_27984 [Hordeum vulgare]
MICFNRLIYLSRKPLRARDSFIKVSPFQSLMSQHFKNSIFVRKAILSCMGDPGHGSALDFVRDSSRMYLCFFCVLLFLLITLCILYIGHLSLTSFSQIQAISPLLSILHYTYNISPTRALFI